MIVCGVDIKSSEAIVAIVLRDGGELKHIECEKNRIALGDDRDTRSLIAMKLAIEAFARQHKIEAFVIKVRPSKGQMAASGVTFKIETLFQLSGYPVHFVSAQAVAKFKKGKDDPIPSTVFGYQSDAFSAAASHLLKH